MTSPIAEIKERIDIVEFIRSYIPLLAAGKNFKALCPFHKEKTPSFMVSPERQTWHCFGACSEGGDIFKFLMKYDNLEFHEALKVLAEKAGVELKKVSLAEHKQFGILYDINQSAKDFFKKELKQSAEALNYLLERGLKKETIEEFELGLSLQEFDTLTRHLINLGYDIKDIERAGLNYKTERGSYVDRFRGRIIFPVYNHFGKVVGFSGRILNESTVNSQQSTVTLAKYINSPETAIFNKSRILYGFHKTKKEILGQKSAVLVEGQMDFLLTYQDGVKNVIATSGTALTPDHLKTLRRIADRLVFLFDNDEAGLKAAERSIDLADSFDFNVGLAILKDYKDPAEAAAKAPGVLLGLVDKTKPAMEFYFERYLGENSKSQILSLRETSRRETNSKLGEFKKNIRIVLGKIKTLASAVERAHWLKELSLKTKIEEKALAEEMEQLKTNSKFQIPNSNEIQNSKFKIQNSRYELIAQRLLSLILAKDDLSALAEEYLDYLPADYRKIYESLVKKTALTDNRLNETMNLISLRSSFEIQEADDDKITREFHDLLKHLKIEYCKDKKCDLAGKIKEAEKIGDEKKLSEILKEFDRVSKLTHNM
jgi:DNA primase